jgi:spatacsin
LVAQQKADLIPNGRNSDKIGTVIMNCARHIQPFLPQKYFDLTLRYNLFRDHAELQMECGRRILSENPDKNQLQEASRFYLLALAYFLHEKCYSLSMECLKKLSLISLQLEISDISVLHLDKSNVLQLMCTKEFPFALTIAVAYDMDSEANWAEAIYSQSIVNDGNEFLTAFQYFRPITSNLCDVIVRRFKQSSSDESQRDRMKGFLNQIQNLVERYRIAKTLDFKDQINTMKESNPVVSEWCEKVLTNKP